MKRFLLLLWVAVASPSTISAQVVQWASELLEFSSELTPVQFSARQILGKPDALPAGGENPNAWTPNKPNNKEFIKIGFETPMSIRQIAVAESFNPSAVFKVFAYDEQGAEYLVNTFNPRTVPLRGRVMNVFMELTQYKVASVKLEMDGAAVPDYFSIDAVAISDSDIPIIADIDVPEDLRADIATERLGRNINSEYEEYKPLLSPDGQTLFFSRKFHPGNIGGEDDPEDIWFSEKSADGSWQKAKNIGPTLNTPGPNFISSVTPDGKTAVLLLGNKYGKRGNMEAGVSISSRENGEWSKPTALFINDDYNYADKANFYLANNRKTLLMSVQRSDSNGDRDLYVSFLQEDSTWSVPENLGVSVNSAGEESAPFLAADDVTLYFSSTGFSGYGAADIYVSRRLDDTWLHWSTPQNLGPTINSPDDDLFFNIPANSKFAYYSKTVSRDDSDIFRVHLPLFSVPKPVILVKGKLYNSETNEPIEAKIVYERLPDGLEVGITKSNSETGAYEILLPAGEMYGFRAEADGYIPISENLDLREEDAGDYTVEGKNIFLAPIEERVTVALNNVFFDFNRSTLKDDSYPELNRVVDLMKERPGMEIQINGHADNTGDGMYNMNLSRRRAQAVSDYLIKNGIDVKRLVVAYFGEMKPTASNDTDSGRQLNRRVEFTIVKN